MGMFDSLYADCPGCSSRVEFQSKAGECVCAEYNVYDCPADVAGDLIGQSRECPVCSRLVSITGRVLLGVR